MDEETARKRRENLLKKRQNRKKVVDADFDSSVSNEKSSISENESLESLQRLIDENLQENLDHQEELIKLTKTEQSPKETAHTSSKNMKLEKNKDVRDKKYQDSITHMMGDKITSNFGSNVLAFTCFRIIVNVYLIYKFVDVFIHRTSCGVLIVWLMDILLNVVVSNLIFKNWIAAIFSIIEPKLIEKLMYYILIMVFMFILKERTNYLDFLADKLK